MRLRLDTTSMTYAAKHKIIICKKALLFLSVGAIVFVGSVQLFWNVSVEDEKTLKSNQELEIKIYKEITSQSVERSNQSNVVHRNYEKSDDAKLLSATPVTLTEEPHKMAWERVRIPFKSECLLNKAPYDPLEYYDTFDINKEEWKNYKKIFLWNNYGYGPELGIAFGIKESCCIQPKCVFTKHETQMPIEDFDAVLMHFRLLNRKGLPLKRSEHQRWIFYETESAAYSYEKPSSYDGVFNWTMTYRLDSDVYMPYGFVFPKTLVDGLSPEDTGSGVKRALANDIEGRYRYMFPKEEHGRGIQQQQKQYQQQQQQQQQQDRRTGAAWLVSNCHTLSNRNEFVGRLSKFYKVGIYGRCSRMKCHPGDKDACYRELEKDYKFYLSLENSMCDDYITEKLFNIFNYDMVPVVRGGGKYEDVAPPHSFISVKDFKDEESLAEYLVYLEGNTTAYMQYFQWKKDYYTLDDSMLRSYDICALCDRLHRDSQRKTYESLVEWFLLDANCANVLGLAYN